MGQPKPWPSGRTAPRRAANPSPNGSITGAGPGPAPLPKPSGQGRPNAEHPGLRSARQLPPESSGLPRRGSRLRSGSYSCTTKALELQYLGQWVLLGLPWLHGYPPGDGMAERRDPSCTLPCAARRQNATRHAAPARGTTGRDSKPSPNFDNM